MEKNGLKSNTMPTMPVEWIGVSIMGIFWSFMSFTTYFFVESHKDIVLLFCMIGIILLIGGFSALIYNIITKKRPDGRIVRCVIFETIGVFFIVLSILVFKLEKTFIAFLPAMISAIFVIEGIILTIRDFDNKERQIAIKYEKQRLGYVGFTSINWIFIYVFFLIGIILIVCVNKIMAYIVGGLFIIAGLISVIKKIGFYIKYNEYKKKGNKNDN